MAASWLWGDLHAHCAVSYGFGTLERALANAEEHLDFCSVTGHAFWPDMPTDVERHDALILKHLGGFAKLQRAWPDVLAQVAAANARGPLVALPSYEWHSRRHGDHNVYGFSSWFAGGGFKAGHIHGATDEFGYKAIVDPVSHSDYHATLLHLLGLDPERLVFRVGQQELHLSDGRHPGRIVEGLLATQPGA